MGDDSAELERLILKNLRGELFEERENRRKVDVTAVLECPKRAIKP